MNANLPGGAGGAISSMTSEWVTAEQTGNPNNFASVNRGQLKAVAQRFYERLIAEGYTSGYPWQGSTLIPNDFSLGNPGQAKSLFSFPVPKFLTPTLRPRIVNSTPTGNFGQEADRTYEEISNFVVDDVRWRYMEFGDPTTVNRTTSNPAICIPNPAKYVTWLHTGDGTVTLTYSAGIIAKSETLTIGSRTTITLDYGAYVAGSAAEHCAAQIDSRIAGKDSSNLSMYSVADHANALYVRNPNFWAADVDLTCVPVWNSSYGGSGFLGCLVTPRVVLFAYHFAPNPGSYYRFITNGNQVVTRQILERNQIPGAGDLGYVLLDSDVFAEIKPAKVLGNLDHLGVEDPAFGAEAPWGVPCFGLNQNLRAPVREAAFQEQSSPVPGRPPFWFNAIPSLGTQRSVMYEDLIINDSGNPCFLLNHGRVVLVTLWCFGDAGAGFPINQYVGAINAKLSELGQPPLTEDNSAEFPLY